MNLWLPGGGSIGWRGAMYGQACGFATSVTSTSSTEAVATGPLERSLCTGWTASASSGWTATQTGHPRSPFSGGVYMGSTLVRVIPAAPMGHASIESRG